MTPLHQLVAACVPPERRAEWERRVASLPGFTLLPEPFPRWIVATRRVAGEAALPVELSGPSGAFVVEGAAPEALIAPQEPKFDAWSELLRPLRDDLGVVQFLPDGVCLVRSVGGRVPLYHAEHGDSLIVSTTLTELVTLLEHEPAADLLAHAAWTGYSCEYPAGRTFFQGVHVVPPGHVSQLARGTRALTTRYWDPPRAPRDPGGMTAEIEHARALRDLLVQRVRNDFPRDGSGLVWLSGGVDSSSLAALVERESIPYSTLSLVPAGSGPVRSREMSYIEGASPHAERHHLSELDPARYAMLPSQAPARLVHCLHPALPATLRLATAHGYRSVMGGEFADEICGGAYTSPDWTRDTSLGVLASRASRGELGVRSVLRWSKHALLRAVERPLVPVAVRLPPCFSPELQEEYAAYRSGWQRRVLSDSGTNATLFAHALGSEFPAMSWEVLAPQGIHRVLPFVNRAVYEWALLTHPTERFDPGTKRLLRRALEGLVPERNLGRADKGSFEVRWPEELVPAPPVPVRFEPLFHGRWLEQLQKTRALPLQERTVVEFLVVFDQATRQARRRQSS